MGKLQFSGVAISGLPSVFGDVFTKNKNLNKLSVIDYIKKRDGGFYLKRAPNFVFWFVVFVDISYFKGKALTWARIKGKDGKEEIYFSKL